MEVGFAFCQLPYLEVGAFPPPAAWPSCYADEVGLSLGLSSLGLQVRSYVIWPLPILLDLATILTHCSQYSGPELPLTFTPVSSSLSPRQLPLVLQNSS